MKVLHLISYYTPAYRYGGPIFSVHTLNKWLVKLGAEVTVYTSNADGDETLDVPVGEPVDVDGVKVFYFPLSKNPILRKWEYSPDMKRALKENIWKFDIVHLDSLFRATAFWGGHYARKFGKPYVISPRGVLMKSPLSMKGKAKKSAYLSLIENRSIRNASAMHFTVPGEKKEFVNVESDIYSFVIPNGYEAEKISLSKDDARKRLEEKYGISRSAPLAVFVARLTWIKGLDSLIPAWAKVKKELPEARLVIAGGDDEGYRKTVEKIIADKGVVDAVRLVGMVGGEDKKALLRGADCFVLPSYSESFGVAVVEAMHAGAPVVITDGVGISPEVKATGAGIVVKKEEKAIADALTRLLKDKELAREMGRMGTKLVHDKFSAEVVAREFLEEYGKVIKAYRN